MDEVTQPYRAVLTDAGRAAVQERVRAFCGAAGGFTNLQLFNIEQRASVVAGENTKLTRKWTSFEFMVSRFRTLSRKPEYVNIDLSFFTISGGAPAVTLPTPAGG